MPHTFLVVVKYIYQYASWPNFTWDEKAINALFGEVKFLQGKLHAQMEALGFSSKDETALEALTLEVVKSSEIEGESLNYDQVRSSIARRLGINAAGLISSNRYVEGVVEMMLDVTRNLESPMTKERLFGWHAALFPTGYSGSLPIEVGKFRTGEMQIVSGPMGRERVHYQAIAAEKLEVEMASFLNWYQQENTLDLVLKAAIAHFWFIIIHPFDDGNGRIGRALTDHLLAKSDTGTDRFYSMSNQILIDIKRYYEVLQEVQHSAGDITAWIHWFLSCLKNALLASDSTTNRSLKKHAFWKEHEQTALNERQRFMLNKLLDGFEGKLKSSKWAKMTKVSADTALRDIKDLIGKGILKESTEGGRSVNYELVFDF